MRGLVQHVAGPVTDKETMPCAAARRESAYLVIISYVTFSTLLQLQQPCGHKSRPFPATRNGPDPAYVLIPNWARSRDAALDVTVINPLQAAKVVAAAATLDHELTAAFKRNVRDSAVACQGHWPGGGRGGTPALPVALLAPGEGELNPLHNLIPSHKT